MVRRVQRQRKALLGGLAAACGVVVAVSAAWACTATSFVAFAPVQVAEVGKQLNANVYAGPELQDTRVDLRLIEGNAPTVLLGSGNAVKGETLSIPVTVPDLAPGVHYVALESAGKVVARAEFQVSGPNGASPAPELVPPRRDLGVHHGSSLVNPGTVLASVGLLAIAVFALTTTRRRRAPSSPNSE